MSEADTLQELQEENELLLLQLHQVQEELEKYYLRNQELEKKYSNAPTAISMPYGEWVDDETLALLAENIRLKALTQAQKKIHIVQNSQELYARLGRMLVRTADKPGTIWKAPIKLLLFWRQESQNTPPDSIGGESYSKVKNAHVEGGLQAVQKFLDKLPLSATVKGNAYTSLARELMHTNLEETSEAAWLAYSVDPKPFRLKWLVFRLYETGSVIKAESFLNLLPVDIKFSDSESKQVNQLRYAAKYAREKKAKQESQFSERKAAAEKKLFTLTYERDQRKAEIAMLEVQLSEAVNLSSKYLEQTNELKKKVEAYKAREIDRTAREKLMQEETARIESQLTFIKEILL